MDRLLLDVKYALRSLSRRPLFATVTVLVLAFGIGVTTNGFAFVNAFLLRPMPFAEPERLVHVWETDRRFGEQHLRAALPNLLDWRRRATTLEGLAAFNYTAEDLTAVDGAVGEPERIHAARVSADVFDLLGVDAELGRTFRRGEDRPGREPVAVISHRFWRTRFGGDPEVAGRTLSLDGTPYTVVGVMPPDLGFPLPVTDVWATRELDPNRLDRSRRLLQVVGRLAPGASLDDARAELARITEAIAREHPQEMEHRGVSVEPLRAALNFAWELIRGMAVVILLADLFLLAIVCSNLMSLQLSRAVERRREMAIRTALGAWRGRLVRQLLTESLVLALAGGALGLLVASWAAAWTRSAVPPDLYRVGDFGVDGPALLVTLGLSVGCALLFGLVPALRAARGGSTGLPEQASAAGPGPGGLRLHRVLSVTQVALAVLLLTACGLALHSLDRMRRVDLGFDADRVLTLKVVLPDSRYAEEEARHRFHRGIRERLQALPGVESAATTNFLPLNHESSSALFTVEGRDPGEEPARANALVVSPGYFRTMGIPLLAGRSFTAADTPDSPTAVVVNRTLAERYWPDGEAVGGRLRFGDAEAVVVGVVADAVQVDLDDRGLAQLHLSQSQRPGSYLRVLLRTGGDPATLGTEARDAVHALDPALPVTEVRSLARVVEEYAAPQAALSAVLGVLGLVALGLASLGIYGVLAFGVARRRREIAVRMALGARREDVLLTVLRRGVLLVAIGVALGLAAASGAGRVMESFLFEVDAMDPVSFVGVPLVLGAVGLAACWLPARRAARVEPMGVLRHG